MSPGSWTWEVPADHPKRTLPCPACDTTVVASMVRAVCVPSEREAGLIEFRYTIHFEHTAPVCWEWQAERVPPRDLLIALVPGHEEE